MKTEIEQALAPLVGLPLVSSGYAGMQWFSFGSLRTIPNHKGGMREVGEYALHLQCSWRIVANDRVVIGASDSAERIKTFFASDYVEPLVVETVQVGAAGAFRLLLSHAHVFEVFPDSSSSDEYSEQWRFFQPGKDADHFVVTPLGIEE